MTSSSRARLSTGLAVAVIAACAIAVAYYYWQIHPLLFEIYALIALFIGFWTASPLRRWLTGLPVIHRAIFAALPALVVAGHLASNVTSAKRTLYPFIAWDIFSAVSDQDSVSCRELIGTTVDGKSVRLLVEQLFPSIIQFDLPPENRPGDMNQLVQALARAYNARHAADPLRAVDLMLVTVHLHPRPGSAAAPPSCQHRYDISSAPSS